MKCKHCGAENQEEVSFCVSCGEALEAEETKSEKKTPKFNKKILTWISVGAVVLLAVIALFALLLGNEAESTTEDLYDAVIEYDFDKVIDLLPPALITHVKGELDLTNSELEIVDSKELEASYVDVIDAYYEEHYGTTRGYIQNATIVYVELTYKGESFSHDRISVYMVEIDGEWYFEPMATFEKIDFTK